MEEAVKTTGNYREIVHRRLALGVSVAVALSLLTLVVALGLPAIYKSKAVILIEQQEIPQDLVRSLITGYADQRIQIIAQRVLTNANLKEIIEKYNLYEEERRNEPLELVMERMRDDILVEPISADTVDQRSGKASKATIAFQLAFDSKSPLLAQRVANDLVSLFLNENLKQRTQATEETLQFLTEESTRLRASVASLEAALAEFKEQNSGALPELTQLNLQLLTSREQDLVQLENQLRSLEQQKVYLESELAQQQPTTALFSSTGQRIPTPEDRLAQLENEYTALRARYGEAHPDVVAMQKEISSLRQRAGSQRAATELEAHRDMLVAELSAAQERYSSAHPEVKRLRRELDSLSQQIDSAQREAVESRAQREPDNPVYIQLKARLEATLAEVEALRGRQASLQKKIDEFEARLTAAPQVERKYRALSRDYENALVKYQEVLAKKQEAEISKSLESEQKGERFTLIEPPITPEQPDRPNRAAIGVLGVLLALAGGVGAGALAETLDQRIYGRLGVVRVVGIPPLAVIPALETKAVRRSRVKRHVLITAIVVIVVLILLAAFNFVIMPLDVFYFRAIRALGM